MQGPGMMPPRAVQYHTKCVHRQEYVYDAGHPVDWNPSDSHSSQMYRRRKSDNHVSVPSPDKTHQTHKPTQNLFVWTSKPVFLSTPTLELLYLAGRNVLHPQTTPIPFYPDAAFVSLETILAAFFLSSAWACGSDWGLCGWGTKLEKLNRCNRK
jgi:hypothetical protein